MTWRPLPPMHCPTCGRYGNAEDLCEVGEQCPGTDENDEQCPGTIVAVLMSRAEYMNTGTEIRARYPRNVYGGHDPELRAALNAETFRLHRHYYGQFVNDQTIRYVVAYIGADAIMASTDEHLNDISMHNWDSACGFRQSGSNITQFATAQFPCNRIAKELGTWLSPADLVCIAKEAARQYRDDQVDAAARARANS